MRTLLLTSLLLFNISIFSQTYESLVRDDIRANLESQLYVREKTGNNDGREVEIYLATVGLGKGHPWCAAFTTWGLDYCSIPNPRSAWSPNWAKKEDRIWSQELVKQRKEKTPKTGDTFTIYYNSLKRVGHVGFYIETSPDGYFVTIEGNTNVEGSRSGIGVFKRKRNPKQVYAVTDYITPHLNKN